jgi:transposase-like protein
MKKVYTAAFKAQVALDLLKEEKTIAQISAEYGVHPNVLRDWRTQALKGLTTIFDRRDDLAATKAVHTQQLEELYAEIGRLTTQLNWLKKKLPPSLIASDER